MSFLDPYSGNRRVSLWWLGRLALLAIVALVGWGAWWAWGRLSG
jgi:hypothetical protein